MPTLDELIVRLDADTKPLEAALKRADRLITNFMPLAETALNRVSGRVAPALGGGARRSAATKEQRQAVSLSVGEGGTAATQAAIQIPGLVKFGIDIALSVGKSAASKVLLDTLLSDEFKPADVLLDGGDFDPRRVQQAIFEFEARAAELAKAAEESSIAEERIQNEQGAVRSQEIAEELRRALSDAVLESRRQILQPFASGFPSSFQFLEFQDQIEDRLKASFEARGDTEGPSEFDKVLAVLAEFERRGRPLPELDEGLKARLQELSAAIEQLRSGTPDPETQARISESRGPSVPLSSFESQLPQQLTDICACLRDLLNEFRGEGAGAGPEFQDVRLGRTGSGSPFLRSFAPQAGQSPEDLAVIEEINGALAGQEQLWRQLGDRTTALNRNIVETERAVVDVDKVARDLGFTFASAFEDAVVNGESFGDILEGLERDILRILTRTLLTEPIAAGIQGGITGGTPGQGGLESILNGLFSPLSALFGDDGTNVGFGSNVGLPPGARSFAGLTVGGGEDGAAAALAEVASSGTAASAGLASAGTGATAAGSQLGGGLVTGVLETIAVKAIETGTSQSLIASLIALEVSATAAAAALANVAGSSAASSFAGLTVGGGATGGLVRGPGSGTSDSIPMRLSNGEFVMSAAATRRHRGLLEALNRDLVPAPLARPGARPPALSAGLARAPQPDATRRRQPAPLPPSTSP